MKSHRKRAVNSILMLLLALCSAAPMAGAAMQPGVLALFNGGKDALILPHVALYVRAGEPATSFLEKGEFSVEFQGSISVELRAQYKFSAVVNGRFELWVNDVPLIARESDGGTIEAEKAIRLNRGTNSLRARLTPPARGGAQVQLLWSSRNIPHPVPVPTRVLSYDRENPELTIALEKRTGLQLFREYRCGRCHEGEDRGLDAPDFTGIGSRLNAQWIADFVKAPSSSHMPRLFGGDVAGEKASAIAAFLATLKGDDARPRTAPGGEELYKTLHCAVCHDDPSPLGRKFKPGALAAYLRDPHAHYTANPMPNFRLSVEEAAALETYLSPKISEGVISGNIEEGRKLVANSGCLSCHKANLPNEYKAPTLAQIARAPDQGCVSDGETGKAPRFQLTGFQRKSLSAFLGSRAFEALSRQVPHEIALSEAQRLRCIDCHDKVEAAPRFSLLGQKLKPDWAHKFITGKIEYKPRPWLKARMPIFPGAENLADGLAALNGVPFDRVDTEPIDTEQATIGAKLISSAGGFSCVACHAVGQYSAGQVVETPGVNLAHSGERLLGSFFQRWVMNPTLLDPSTKMPVYFDEQGRSQLTDILDGSGRKQIEAMWHYIMLGEKMPAPPVP